MRVALLTLEALASASPVRRLVAQHADRIAYVALSDPYRPQQGGMFGQAVRLLRRSGPRLLPYMIANFSLPRVAGLLPIRRRTPEQKPMALLCAAHAIPVETVDDMNDPGFLERLRGSGADLILTFHCDQILTQRTIACLPHGAVNVHAGLLPDHRGPVPTIHALLEDPPRFGVTLHRLVPRIDAGPVLVQVAVDLPATMSALEAATELHAHAVPLVLTLLDALAAGSVTERVVEPGPYCGFPTPAQLRQLARSKRSAASWRDVLRALLTPVG
ncbi:MAG: formyltransferase family protein [Rhodopila sp.]|jgi:methionyl-tRNA formyltransferase